MRLLITGSQGQLGRELQRQMRNGKSELGKIPSFFRGADLDCVDLDVLDISDRLAVLAYCKKCKPDVVINCAAYTHVDSCESHPEDAYKANAIGPRNLAEAVEAIGAKLMHISTDYVFAGDQAEPRREYDLPDPISVYGKTKYAGEREVARYCSRHCIIRTAWLYGRDGRNFVKTILRIAAEQGEVTVVNDQYGNPTNAEDLAHHILKLAAAEAYGLYHCTGNGICSWYDFACKIVEYSGIQALVKPCASDAYPTPAKRPAYSALDNMALRLSLGDEMRDWQTALQSYFT